MSVVTSNILLGRRESAPYEDQMRGRGKTYPQPRREGTKRTHQEIGVQTEDPVWRKLPTPPPKRRIRHLQKEKPDTPTLEVTLANTPKSPSTVSTCSEATLVVSPTKDPETVRSVWTSPGSILSDATPSSDQTPVLAPINVSIRLDCLEAVYHEPFVEDILDSHMEPDSDLLCEALRHAQTVLPAQAVAIQDLIDDEMALQDASKPLIPPPGFPLFPPARSSTNPSPATVGMDVDPRSPPRKIFHSGGGDATDSQMTSALPSDNVVSSTVETETEEALDYDDVEEEEDNVQLEVDSQDDDL